MSAHSLSEPRAARPESVDRVGRYRIVHKTGAVQDVQVRSQQTTSTYGGGGMLHNGSGYIAAPTTSTISKSWQRVFVADDGGGEWHFEVGDGFPVRRGNRIKASYVSKGKGQPILAAVRNVDSGEGWRWPMSSVLPRYSALILLWVVIAIVWSIYKTIGVADSAAPRVLMYFFRNGPLIPLLVLFLGARWWQRRATQQKLWRAMGHS